MVNLAYLHILGFKGMQESEFIASAAMRQVFGANGSKAVSILIIFATLSSINGCIFTGARSIYAMGNNNFGFHWLGKWDKTLKTPVNALILQGLIAIVLIFTAGVGHQFRHGFETLVEYTAPVFWFFLLLIGISAFSLFKLDKKAKRTINTINAFLFCGMCFFMLYSSLVYTKLGASIGVCVLLIGLPIYFLSKSKISLFAGK